MEDPKNKITYDDPERCVKGDPKSVGPCSCPKCIEEARADTSYIQKGIVLTDENMVPGGAQHRVAFHFKCLACGNTNVADYMSYCPDCGMRVIVRSHKVMDFLKNHVAQNTGK